MTQPSDTPESGSDSPKQPARRSRSLKARAVVGSAWTVGGFGAMQSIRLASNILLAWLLFPEAFGLMALVAIVTSALEMFSSIGLHAAVVQNERGDDPDFLNNVWTLQIIRGFILWGVASLVAFPVANFYGEPRLAELIPVAAFACVIRGAKSTKFLWNQRQLQYGRNTLIQVIGRSAGVAAMLTLAWMWRDVWALVIGGLAGNVIVLGLSHLVLPGPGNRLRWDSPTVLALLSFGKWLFVSTVLTFFARQLDKILLGALVPLGTLGVYHVAFALAMMPSGIIQRVTQAVLFPAFAKHHRSSPDTLHEKVRLARRTVLLPAVFIILGVVLLAPAFFRILYEADYHDAGWMAQLVSVAVWFTCLTAMSARALLARGVTWVFAATNAANALVTAGACLAGFELFGMAGFILGYGLGNVCGYGVVQCALLRHGMSMWRQDMGFTGLLVTLIAAGLAAQWSAWLVFEQHMATLLEFAVAGVILAGYGAWAGPRVLTLFFGPGWRGLWMRLDRLSGGRLAWAIPGKYRTSSSLAR